MAKTIYQICVSGAARGDSVEQGQQLANAVGEAIARAGHALLTGATTGLPEAAAIGYKRAGGASSLGISPATSKVEHVLKYRLPTDSYDAILYTGLHYTGRDALLINSSDGVVSVGGQLGTLHEFTIAMETRTPFGLLQGAGGVSDEIEKLIDILPNAHKELIVIDSDADSLVAKLTKLIDKQNVRYRSIYQE